MKDLSIWIPKKGTVAEVKVSRKGRDVTKFKTDRSNFIVYKESTNEVFVFNKFTGCQIPNHFEEGKPMTYKPGSFVKVFKTKGKVRVHELDLLKKNLEERDIISLAFLNKSENDLKEVFPGLVQEAVLEHKKRFSNG